MINFGDIILRLGSDLKRYRTKFHNKTQLRLYLEDTLPKCSPWMEAGMLNRNEWTLIINFLIQAGFVTISTESTLSQDSVGDLREARPKDHAVSRLHSTVSQDSAGGLSSARSKDCADLGFEDHLSSEGYHSMYIQQILNVVYLDANIFALKPFTNLLVQSGLYLPVVTIISPVSKPNLRRPRIELTNDGLMSTADTAATIPYEDPDYIK